ncbi:Tat Hypothetical protein protein 1(TBP-1)-interacting protein (TBPIP) [Nesidiocoris tenuis]|uniref:Homologous-pairing protein 2 homolog n=1 Tax=Nesidiocoris tenuis TaxID=355587 RepID=A0ABN7AQR2_9HEMI|nr:Tat Hypothetical protein protein 1(TBP-1)-interacting protein (TBPIP) [Nesidiocoris tenuis]
MSKEVLKFMITANRPYSANDVSQALRDLGKSAVQKSLDSLVDNGSLYVKEYNKQKIYCVVQRDELSSRDEVEELDLKIRSTQEELNRLKVELTKAQAKVKSLNSSKTTEQLTAENAQLQEEIDGMRAKVASFEKAGRSLTKTQMEEVTKKWDFYVKTYRKRKRIANDILDQILESYPKSKKHLYEDIGIEDDESVGMPKLSS